MYQNLQPIIHEIPTEKVHQWCNFPAYEWVLTAPTYAQSDSNRVNKMANTSKYDSPQK